MQTNDVDYLLYCFADEHDEALDCHLINFVELKPWFWWHEEGLPALDQQPDQSDAVSYRAV